MTNESIDPNEYEGFRLFLEQACGIVLGDNKHYLVSSRLNPLLAELGIRSVTELLGRLRRASDPLLREQVIDAMTTNETSWFRENYLFDIFKNTILPQQFEKQGRSLRIWSAGCSSGQEPYSISMAVQEYLDASPSRRGLEVEIIATDISPSMLKHAANGCYDKVSSARGLSPERRARFFTQRGVFWEVNKNIRRRVNFKPANLRVSFQSLGKFDVVFCRNVLIYFSSELKRDILARAAAQINTHGYFILGAAESLANHCDAFEMVRFPDGIVYRLKQDHSKRQ